MVLQLISFVLLSITLSNAAERVSAEATSENITTPEVIQPADELTPIHNEKGELYQHDIMLTPEQSQILLGNASSRGTAFLSRRWPEGSDGMPFVRYQLIGTVDQDAIRDGISHVESKTCIKFEEENETQEPHLKFVKDSGCWSYIGYTGWSYGQEVSIDNGCTSLGIVAHEIGHAMGLFHEQSRPSRDDYVVVLTGNILSTYQDQFTKKNPTHVNYYGVPYDFTSDMHYSSFGFTSNGGMTIATIDPLDQELIGQRGGFSHRDALLLNRMYSCIDKWLDSCNMTSDPCLNDGYTGQSCECVCPPGTTGIHCQHVVGDYYDDKRHNCSQVVTSEGTISSTNYPNSYARGVCTTWIMAPECMVPMITFTDFDVPCSDRLIVNHVDRYNGPSLCNNGIEPGDTFRASTNEMVLIHFNSRSASGWLADLQFVHNGDCTPTTPSPEITPSTTTPSTTTPSTTTPSTTTPSTTTPSTTTPSTTEESTTSSTEAPAISGPQCKVESIGSAYRWTSPGFKNGNTYPHNFNCHISDVMPQPMQTVYKLKTFALERKREGKCVDHVSLALPYSRVLRFCRPRKTQFRVPNSRFLASFESNPRHSYRGFDIAVSHVRTPCHRIVDLTDGRSTKGIIQSPNYPKRFPANTQCEWWIKAPPGRRVRLNITRMRIRYSARCTRAYLVMDKSGTAAYKKETSKIVCGRQRGRTLSTGDTMNVVFDGGSRKAKGFRARYEVY